jgi:hypothetical protein
MPTKEAIPAGSVAETQLQPHLRNKGKSRSTSNINILQGEYYLMLTLGESVGQGKAIGIGADGKAYLSKLDASFALPCVAVAMEDGVINDIVKCKTSGVYYDPAGSYQIGETLYLGDAGTISTDIPVYTVGHYLQMLGKATGANMGLLTISAEFVCR